jgi:quercetin dioxygenase-like cupin family protein
MTTMRRICIAALLVLTAGILSPRVASAQGPGLTRTDLLRHDLRTPGREVIQVLVEFAPGATAPNHSHPGEEIAYVVEGVFEYTLAGSPPVTLKPGESLFIPAGTPHSVRLLGSGKGAELATYVVEKGKPLLTLVP